MLDYEDYKDYKLFVTGPPSSSTIDLAASPLTLSPLPPDLQAAPPLTKPLHKTSKQLQLVLPTTTTTMTTKTTTFSAPCAFEPLQAAPFRCSTTKTTKTTTTANPSPSDPQAAAPLVRPP
ncbi:unnamed protein product [Caenorhabditis brenneri]